MNWKQVGLESLGSVVSETGDGIDSPAFAPLVSDAFEHIGNLPPRRDVAAGTTLLMQGERCGAVYLIMSGLVKLVSASAEGRSAILGLRTAGWCAGAAFAMAKKPSLYSVVTLTAGEVIKVPAQDFSSLLANNSKLMQHFTATLCNEAISQTAALAEVMTRSAEERLATFMKERLLDRPHDKVLDALPFLRQNELANLLCITPEHLSRLLQRARLPQGANAASRSVRT